MDIEHGFLMFFMGCSITFIGFFIAYMVASNVVMKKEPKELSEEQVLNTKFTLSVQTMIAAGTGIASLVGMWYMLQADIQEAKELPNLESLYEN